MKLKSGIVLGDNENLVMELEAELWATSQNPIAQIIGQIKKLIGLLFGIKREGFVVITDKRVVEVIQGKACWVLNTALKTGTGLLFSILNVGIRQVVLLFFVCVLVAAGASYLPTKKIAMKRPIDAIRDR